MYTKTNGQYQASLTDSIKDIVQVDDGYDQTVACYPTDIMGSGNNYGTSTSVVRSECMVFGLKDKPVSSSTTVVQQMPTTGAPEGLSTIGLVAIIIGLLGVTAMRAHRRRV
ncbi:hypothetical protein [Bifidobacterium callitrichidarum]|uniref:Gram-positive cocci surface proteins LPxTG domain-containing protein n=1 Tax=Bifidobacterium callitrichidarum TaxID=2052941 RepID=A0A2U2NCB2_9BIFI|nr:hypothetical protein [Bifidobacterium callitrichidarum]PWG66785.1 hypothetical protein DF196_02460 [Bifidobacterium callitrichidarum]